MGYWVEGEVTIPAKEWIDFVIKFTPVVYYDDTEIGDPRYDEEGNVVVPFATNTYCHPREQIEPPKFLQK